MYMTKYEDIIKQAKNKNTSVDEIAQKYKMSVTDVKVMQEWKKRTQEAEGELSILKGIETNRVKEAQTRSDHLQTELDRVNKEKNDLFIRIAELIETNEKEVKNLKWIKDHDYIFLIDENKKLHADIKKLKETENQVEKARRAGM